MTHSLALLSLLLPSAGPVYQHGAVAADHAAASRAGVEMLELGGNAVDAAVAASFCLSVVRPYSCGLGGGGFMLIHDPGNGAVALDYRETAPAAVGPDYYVKLGVEGAASAGYHASGVPGSVAGLLHALEHYGTLDRATVLGPALRAATEGWAADRSHEEAVEGLADRLAERPDLRPAAAFLWETLCGAGSVRAGAPLRNPRQAKALRLIADGGAEAFYRGPIGAALVRAMREHGGTITAADLAGYAVRVEKPLRGTFRGLEIIAMPPPSSGGVAMLQVLGILERRLDDLMTLAHNDPAYVHLAAEAMKHAFADRAAWLADPAFVDVPVQRLLSAGYLADRAATVGLKRTWGPAHYGSAAAGVVDGGTSHLSVIDGDGMAVACTETINLVWGSMVAVPGYGFALNDQMDDFTTVPGQPNEFKLIQSERNLPEPGKRPLSSMSPTIALDGGRAALVAGASGGPRIITATLQCLLNCAVFGMTPAEAVAAPRFHHQWLPDVLFFERRWSGGATVAALEALGHETARREDIGVVQLIRVTEDGIRAASDPRKGGRAAGY